MAGSSTEAIGSEKMDHKRPMDLNNEMVDMRKHLRKAKRWAVSKLMKSSRALREKTGNEIQTKKNNGRADRLEEEIVIIKKSKPDELFKALLQLDHNVSDLTKLHLSLEERAVIRVGSVKFINQKMKTIRDNVSDFHFKRTQKRTPSALQAAKRLRESEPLHNDVIVDSSNSDKEQSPVKMSSATSNRIQAAAENYLKHTSADGHSNDNILVQNEGSHNTCAEEEGDSGDGRASDDLEDDLLPSNRESQDGYVSDGQCNELSADKAEEEKYQEALSSYYAMQQEVVPRADFNTLAKDAVDVTEVLHNIGDGFSSADEDEDSDQEISYNDLVEAGHKARLEGLEDGLSQDHNILEEDLFFVDRSGSTDKSFTRHKKTSETDAFEESAEREIKSSFLGSLSEWHGRSRGKNRPGQRARKKVRRVPKADGGEKVAAKSKKTLSSAGTETRRDKNNVSGSAKPAKPSLHPSWEASKRRKQEQTTFKPFQGKRVCFDDSD